MIVSAFGILELRRWDIVVGNVSNGVHVRPPLLGAMVPGSHHNSVVVVRLIHVNLHVLVVVILFWAISEKDKGTGASPEDIVVIPAFLVAVRVGVIMDLSSTALMPTHDALFAMYGSYSRRKT